jgi:chloramphenicol-sensitive protein RarD
LILFGAILMAQGHWREVAALIRGPAGPRVALAGAIVALNWGLFIWAIQTGHAVQASLGYYILPLCAVLLGVAVLGERLSAAQSLAVGLAVMAVATLSFGLGQAPWIALSLAFSFAPYMLIKKGISAPAVVSVTAEVLIIAPFAIAYLAYAHSGGTVFGRTGGLFGQEVFASLMLPITGFITGLPLILFSIGAQNLRLSTLGLIQYLNPTLQGIVAVLWFHEPVTVWHALAFAPIWSALAVYSWAGWRADRAAVNAVSSDARSSAIQ